MLKNDDYTPLLEGRLPLIGTPIKQVKTPPLVNKSLKQNGVIAEMKPIDLHHSQVEHFFAALRGSENALGCSVTIPYKIQARNNMDELTGRARRLGVVNTVRRESDGRLVGDITDGIAMSKALLRVRSSIHGATILIVGAAGGAGRAIADAFAEAGAARIILIDLDSSKLAETKSILSGAFRDVEFLDFLGSQTCDIAVNASPLGMKPSDELPFDLSLVSRGGVVCDAVTTDPQSKLIEKARLMGFVTVDGREMAACQIDQQLDHWQVFL